MIVINTAPKELDFCGNSLLFYIDSTNCFASAGNVTELVLNVVSAVVSGNMFSFTLDGKIIRFDVVAALDFSGNTILNGSTAAEISTSLINNYTLQKHYNISYLGSKISIKAKEKGSFFNLIFFSNSANIVSFSNTSGTDKTLRTGYKTLCELYLEKERNTNIFENISSSLYDVDDSGRCELKPGRLLSKYFTDIDLPDYNQTLYKKVNKTVKRYFVKLAEMYDNSVKLVKTSVVLNAVDGTIEDASLNYLTDIATTKNYLLDPHILKIETWTSAQQYLYYISYLASTTIKEMVNVYFTDGSSQLDIVKNTTVSALRGETFIFPTGYEQLNLGAIQATKEIYKYEIRLQDTTNILLGKIITYYILPKPIFAREFWFKNSIGSMESVLCEKQVHKLDVKRSELLTAEFYHTDVEEITNSYECSTGNKSKVEIEHLAQFITSKQVYLLHNGSRYLVSLEGGAATLVDENEDLYFFKFKYRIVSKENVVIPVVIIPGSLSNAFSNAFARA